MTYTEHVHAKLNAPSCPDLTNLSSVIMSVWHLLQVTTRDVVAQDNSNLQGQQIA